MGRGTKRTLALPVALDMKRSTTEGGQNCGSGAGEVKGKGTGIGSAKTQLGGGAPPRAGTVK